MFHSFQDLKGYAIRARDGRKGHVEDLYFEDNDWQVRYLVAATGFPLLERQSLIGVDRLDPPDTAKAEFPVQLTEDEIAEAPEPSDAPPVSEQPRQRVERERLRWPSFMVGAVGAGYTPLLAEEHIRGLGMPDAEEPPVAQTPDNPNLRSMNEVRGYGISASDGEVGSVSDFLIDPETWRVRYLVVDTGNWLPGRLVVIARDWVRSIDWSGRTVEVKVTKERIETSPELREIDDLDRSREEMLFSHYGMAGYWL